MLYFHTHGDRIPKKSPFKTWQAAQARIRLATPRSASARINHDVTACYTSGSTPVVSTKHGKSNLRRALILCLAGTVILPDAMFSYQVFRSLVASRAASRLVRLGYQLSARVGG